MQYTEFGKLGYQVSRLGFGAMRLPKDEAEAIKVIRRALDLGVNYVDTAPGYMDGTSEVTVGKAIKGYRDKILLSTKNPIEDASGENWRKRLDKSLRQLDTDYIDFYHMWGISWKTWEERINVPNGPLEAAYKAKEAGLIRHISFSFHDDPDKLLKLIETGIFESMLVQYNLLDRSNEEGLALAHAKGLGTVVMGPVGGGRLGAPSKQIQEMIPGGVRSTAEMALRFVISNPNINVALSGMGTIEMVEQNVATASREESLSDAEKAMVAEMLEENKRLAELYCTGCNYCMPCPNGVKIPENFRLMNYHKVYGLTAAAQNMYQEMKGKDESSVAEACVECGACEPKCPQHIPIIKQLQETAEALAR